MRRVWVKTSEMREGGRTKGGMGGGEGRLKGEGKERRGAREGRSGIQNSMGGESGRVEGFGDGGKRERERKGCKMDGGW